MGVFHQLENGEETPVLKAGKKDLGREEQKYATKGKFKAHKSKKLSRRWDISLGESWLLTFRPRGLRSVPVVPTTKM